MQYIETVFKQKSPYMDIEHYNIIIQSCFLHFKVLC